MYTFTTIGGVTKPPVPATTPHSAAFPLPYEEDFDGMLVGAEAPYFGDQMGKFETVAAGGGRSGNASRQQLPLGAWPICNRGHSQVRRSMHQDCLLNPRNFVFYPFFTHFPPFFAHFLRLDARNPENTARSPGENGKKSIKIGENRGN